jgi:hypothetical protein
LSFRSALFADQRSFSARHPSTSIEFAVSRRVIGLKLLMDLPIACTLTESELKERRRTVLNLIRDSAIDARSIPGGYSYRFRPSSEVLSQLFNLVDLERQCCAFLTFKIVVEPQQSIALEVSGPPNAIDMVADLFGSL